MQVSGMGLDGMNQLNLMGGVDHFTGGLIHELQDVIHEAVNIEKQVVEEAPFAMAPKGIGQGSRVDAMV